MVFKVCKWDIAVLVEILVGFKSLGLYFCLF